MKVKRLNTKKAGALVSPADNLGNLSICLTLLIALIPDSSVR